jgi:hypothetical protein
MSRVVGIIRRIECRHPYDGRREPRLLNRSPFVIARSVGLSSLLLVPSVLGAQALPSLPTVHGEACTVDQCRWTTLDTLQVYAHERDSTRPVAALAPGESFSFDSTNFYTFEWGIIVARRPMRLIDELSPEADNSSVLSDPGARAVLARRLEIGDTMYHLGTEDETGEVVWLDGVTVRAAWFWVDADSQDQLPAAGFPGLLVRPIHHEWWVRLRADRGRHGWVQVWNKRIER